jgi:hypothetical protein
MKLRFSIRDLLWLTLVAALCTGWWISRCWYSAQVERLQETATKQDLELKQLRPSNRSYLIQLNEYQRRISAGEIIIKSRIKKADSIAAPATPP